ncbi:MAG: hypothetical protein D6687_02725 [Acidobacteria bacterium]|nr:MAG: hypothetical protein D6687_02725 [Acidobacteriota bacterium]
MQLTRKNFLLPLVLTSPFKRLCCLLLQSLINFVLKYNKDLTNFLNFLKVCKILEEVEILKF